MFVFGHVPAYRVSDEGKGPFPDLYYFPKHRDAFWNSLREAGVSMYFCGHVHFYCRVTKDGVQQVLIGNGGANPVDFEPKKVDPTVTLNYPLITPPIAMRKCSTSIRTAPGMCPPL